MIKFIPRDIPLWRDDRFDWIPEKHHMLGYKNFESENELRHWIVNNTNILNELGNYVAEDIDLSEEIEIKEDSHHWNDRRMVIYGTVIGWIE